MDTTLNMIYQSVVEGNKEDVEDKVGRALEDGISPQAILDEGLISGMKEVGDRFEMGDFFVPEMLIAARAMKAGLTLLKPFLIETGIEISGKVVIGTVKGDLHDIGKNLVSMMLEGAGFEVIDLGTDVEPSAFATAIKEYNPDVVGLSALLTTTMNNMGSTIEVIEDQKIRDKVKIIVGGAPITKDFAEEIGADGYAPDASQAVKLINLLLNN